jgi:Leucine-rich repeat (LRR) protein
LAQLNLNLGERPGRLRKVSVPLGSLLPRLQELNLSFNALGRIDDISALGKLRYLRDLNLAENSISDLTVLIPTTISPPPDTTKSPAVHFFPEKLSMTVDPFIAP